MPLKKLVAQCFTLVIVVMIAFIIHSVINNSLTNSIEINQIILSYSVNIMMALAVIICLFLLQRKFKDQLGFIFMGASMLKFIIFFIVFYPIYNLDKDLSRLEFSTFFIPYVICLISESVILSKLFNSLDHHN